MEQIKRYLKQNQSRFVQELCEYVKLPSVSAQEDHRKDVLACAEWLRGYCQQIGLEASLFPTAGNPILLARTPRGHTRRPHFLVYGHYDVQPPEPFELWKTPPFEPQIRNNRLFGRGASDNKGQHLAHLNAVEAFLRTGTELPCDLTFLIEGEEEVGSSNIARFLKTHRAELKCDAVVISDTGMAGPKHPALTYALRGIAAVEIRLEGPSRDLHSGIYGGSVENPAMALCRLLAQLRDDRGRVTIPGFYDAVVALTKYERQQLAQLPYQEDEYREFLGVPALFGEAGFSAWEQRSARPTLEINGLTSGYQGQGSKTIVPAWASAKLTMRLVPRQDPAHILKIVEKHLTKICPNTVRLRVEKGHCGEPYYVSPEGPRVQAALRAVKTAFGYDPVLLREGGSIPIVNDFKRILGADSLLVGLALPDDNAHSPNEKFDLNCFIRGMWMSANLWRELATIAEHTAPESRER